MPGVGGRSPIGLLRIRRAPERCDCEANRARASSTVDRQVRRPLAARSTSVSSSSVERRIDRDVPPRGVDGHRLLVDECRHSVAPSLSLGPSRVSSCHVGRSWNIRSTLAHEWNEINRSDYVAGSMSVADRIRERGDRLTPSERRIAAVVLATPQVVGFGTVADLADAAGAGAATVVRLANKLGYDGLRRPAGRGAARPERPAPAGRRADQGTTRRGRPRRRAASTRRSSDRMWRPRSTTSTRRRPGS